MDDNYGINAVPKMPILVISNSDEINDRIRESLKKAILRHTDDHTPLLNCSKVNAKKSGILGTIDHITNILPSLVIIVGTRHDSIPRSIAARTAQTLLDQLIVYMHVEDFAGKQWLEPQQNLMSIELKGNTDTAIRDMLHHPLWHCFVDQKRALAPTH